MPVARDALIEIGTRWSSSLVLAEAELALHRWREDVTRLRAYGWGERRRAAFEALVDRLRARHDALTTLKSIKLGTAPAEASARKHAAVWLERARSILESAELEHESASTALAVLPAVNAESASELITAVRATVAQARAIREALEPEAATDEFFTGGEMAAYTLEAARAGSNEARVDTAEQRAELDALDGEIYLTIRGLNRAGARLFHADGNEARAARYAFQFLVTIAARTDEDTATGASTVQVQPAAPVGSPDDTQPMGAVGSTSLWGGSLGGVTIKPRG